MPVICLKIRDKFYCGAKNAHTQRLCTDMIFDNIHKDCRMLNADLTCSIGGGIKHKEPELISEMDLPKNISEDQYNWWHDRSFVEFIRIGPKFLWKDKKC